MIGQKILHYEILEKLGEGGMGVVYKARDTKLDRFVAIKFLPHHLNQTEAPRRRFVHEAKAASTLDHPNICTIHEISETDEGQMFIVMSYYPGNTLREKIDKGSLPLDKTFDIIIAVCEGIARAHEESIVHRDIKPENIMLTDRGEVKLVDFGLAKLAGQSTLTKEGTTLGTMSYMSPEQIEGNEVDHRSDIWALGVVLYEMIAGRQPFGDEYAQAAMYAILHETPEPLTALRTGVPMELERIVNKALEKDRELRYQSALDLLADLKKISRSLEPGANVTQQKPVSPPIQKKNDKFSKQLVIPVIAILLLTIALLLLPPFFQEDPLVSSPKPVVVMPFENQTGDESFDYLRTAIPNLLITNLEQSKYLNVITWERMQDVLKLMGRTNLELVDIDKEAGFELCRFEGVPGIVLGSFTRAGETFATDIKVLDVDSKRLLKSSNATGEGVSSVIREQIDQLSEAISQSALTTFPAAEPETFNLAEVTTQSMEAYRYYLEGVKNYIQFLEGSSLRNLTRVVELDSSFAMAYYYIARIYNNLGNRTARDDAIRKAMTYSKESTEREKLFIRMDYAQKIELNREKALKLNEELVRRFPKEKRAFLFLGAKYRFDSRIYDAIAAYQRATELDPTWGPGFNALGYCYAAIGEFEKAERTLRKYVELAPNEANPYDSLGEIYLMMGRLDDAILNFKRVREIIPDWLNTIQLARIYEIKQDYTAALEQYDSYLSWPLFPGFRATAMRNKALAYFHLGRYPEAHKILNAQIAIADSGRVELHKATAHELMAFVYTAQGDKNNAERQLKICLEIRLNDTSANIAWANFRYLCLSAFFDLKNQKTDEVLEKLALAKEYIAQIKTQQTPIYRNWIEILEGEIALVQGRLKDAVSLLKKVNPISPYLSTRNSLNEYTTPVPRDGLARAYYASKDLDSAIKEYERLTSFDPNSPDRFIPRPQYHYRLAKLYEENGWPGLAIQRYEKFLEIWKDADKDLPELIDAKERLTKLKE